MQDRNNAFGKNTLLLEKFMRLDNVSFLNHHSTWGQGDAWWSTDGIVTDRSGFNYSFIRDSYLFAVGPLRVGYGPKNRLSFS